MNYGPLSANDADNATYSFKATSCVNSASDLFFADGYGCSAQAINMQDATCGADTTSEIFLAFYCPQAPAAPGATPTPLTTEPIAEPIAAPISVPAAMTTPAKASSAPLTSFSIVGAAVAVFSYFL